MQIGSYNMFEVKSKMATDVVIGDDCNIGNLPSSFKPDFLGKTIQLQPNVHHQALL